MQGRGANPEYYKWFILQGSNHWLIKSDKLRKVTLLLNGVFEILLCKLAVHCYQKLTFKKFFASKPKGLGAFLRLVGADYTVLNLVVSSRLF